MVTAGERPSPPHKPTIEVGTQRTGSWTVKQPTHSPEYLKETRERMLQSLYAFLFPEIRTIQNDLFKSVKELEKTIREIPILEELLVVETHNYRVHLQEVIADLRRTLFPRVSSILRLTESTSTQRYYGTISTYSSLYPPREADGESSPNRLTLLAEIGRLKERCLESERRLETILQNTTATAHVPEAHRPRTLPETLILDLQNYSDRVIAEYSALLRLHVELLDLILE